MQKQKYEKPEISTSMLEPYSLLGCDGSSTVDNDDSCGCGWPSWPWHRRRR